MDFSGKSGLPSGANSLHGGIGTGAGYAEKLWTVTSFTEPPNSSLRLALQSPDGEGGFPGNLEISLCYTVTKDNALQIEYELKSDRITVTNLTSHAFFNLEGLDSQSVSGHWLQLHADGYTVADHNDIPTGEIAPVQGTPLDFSAPKRIGADLDKLPEGYNHNYAMSCKANQPAANLYSIQSGIGMRVWTDQPGIQLYTAGRVAANKIGKGGKRMCRQGAVCLETLCIILFFQVPFCKPGR